MNAVMLRWAVLSASGKNLRVYAHNRMLAAKQLAAVGERLVYAMAAGYHHPSCGEVRPAWDTAKIHGWPGGPSGRPGSAGT